MTIVTTLDFLQLLSGDDCDGFDDLDDCYLKLGCLVARVSSYHSCLHMTCKIPSTTTTPPGESRYK